MVGVAAENGWIQAFEWPRCAGVPGLPHVVQWLYVLKNYVTNFLMYLIMYPTNVQNLNYKCFVF
jgi:hypothetical protein